MATGASFGYSGDKDKAKTAKKCRTIEHNTYPVKGEGCERNEDDKNAKGRFASDFFFADTQLDCFVPICSGRVCRCKPALASDGYFYKNYRRLHLRRTDEG